MLVGQQVLVLREEGASSRQSPWRGELASPRLAYLTLPISHLLPTFRSLKNGFLDINYCSSYLFCLTIAKPKSTRKRTCDLFLVLTFEPSVFVAMVNICKSGIKGAN